MCQKMLTFFFLILVAKISESYKQIKTGNIDVTAGEIACVKSGTDLTEVCTIVLILLLISV